MFSSTTVNKKIPVNLRELDKILQRKRNIFFKKLKKKFPSTQNKSLVDEKTGSRISQEYLLILEKEISSIASNYNRFGLLVALHHVIPPIPLIIDKPSFYPDSQQAFITCNLAVMKYSKSSRVNTKYKLEPYQYLNNPKTAMKFTTNKYVILDVLLIESLIRDLLESNKVFRMAEKGAKVKIDFTHTFPINYVENEQLEKLTKEYDDRTILESKRNLGTGSGGYATYWKEYLSPISIPILQINWKSMTKPNPTPYKISQIGILPFYDAWLALKKDLNIKFGSFIIVEDVIAFIISSFEIIKRFEIEKKQTPGLGYDFTTKKRFLSFIVDNFEKNKNHVITEKVGTFLPFVYSKIFLPKSVLKDKVIKILDYISLSEADSKTINLLIQKPCSFIFKLDSDECVFFPYNNTLSFFNSLLRAVPKSSKFKGEIQGVEFESLVNQSLTQQDNVNEVLKPGTKVKLGQKIISDIDCLVSIDNCALLISCKAYSESEKHQMGIGQEYWEMWQEQLSWIKKVDNLAKVISRQKTSVSDRIPNNLKYVIPIVCTSFPWYQWEHKPKLRLPNKSPRIVTLRELLDFIKSFKKYKKELTNQKYSIRVTFRD